MPAKKYRNLIVAGFIASVITLISMGLHEFGHAVMSYWVGVKIIEAGFYGIFAYVRPEVAISQLTPMKEILISAAGPLTNFLIAAIFAIPVAIYRESISENTLQYIVHVNILLAIYNLIPFPLLDGGKFLHGLIRFAFNDPQFAWTLVYASFFYLVMHWSFVRKDIVQKVEDKLEVL